MSFLKPKLTNLLKSENTSRLCPSGAPPAAPPDALDPVDGPLGPGPVILAKMPSPAPPIGSAILLAPGLTREPPACPVVGGSISSDERKELLPRSVLVLVMTSNASWRLLCVALGVPFRSRICRGSTVREAPDVTDEY